MTRRREEDLAGQRFGRLVAQARSDRSRGRRTYWVCVCDCGRTIEARADGLKCGDNITCGCGQPQRMRDCHTKHGLSNTGTYAAWESMWRRCSDPRDKGYRLYGGRGIKVCDRWRDVAAFLADMGARPPGRSLDRIDNDGDYSPKNCRWATQTEQCRNMRRNVVLTFNGESLCISEWAQRIGQSHDFIRKRLQLGWTVERAITTPKTQRGRS